MMKSISQATWEKIHRLGGRSFWSRVFGSSEEQVELLRDIGLSGEAAAIPKIAWLLVDASGPVWRAAAEAVHRLLETLSPLDLAALDQRIREVGIYDREVDRQWRKLSPSGLSRFASSEFAVSLFGLASFHGSGYVREAAVENLAAHNSGQELPFLLIRLNDWVAPVRDAAARAVNARLRPEYAQHFLRSLQLVLRLETCGRANRALVDIVCGLLRRAECREVLQAGLKSSDRALRRASFQLVGPLMQTLADETPSVSREAMKALLPKAWQQSLDEYWKLFANDRRAFVRRNALTLMLRFGKWEKLPPLLLACADEDRRLAGLAQNALGAWSRNYNSSFAEPTRIDLERIQDALRRVEESLPRGAAAEIRACLKIYSK